MKKYVLIAILAVIAWQVVQRGQTPSAPSATATTHATASASPRSGSQFESEGTVVKVLADDTQGSRHQRFIVRLPSGQTVLIAHNIDIAPRVAGLSEGDAISFSGDYEANDKGGVVHWTHRDPSGRHVAGWIKHRGRTYQ